MQKTKTRFSEFMRKNAIYFILAFCILAVGLTVTLMMISNANKIDEANVIETPIDDPVVKPDPVTPDDPAPVIKTITFISPVENASSVMAYTESMTFNQTLKRYESHKATDFIASEGANVLAVYEGTVESVDNTLLDGVTVVINHGNGLKTVYNSLSDDEFVKVGQTVSQGDIIGKVSATNRRESALGAHLHFEVLKEGVSIDPVAYLVIDEK